MQENRPPQISAPSPRRRGSFLWDWKTTTPEPSPAEADIMVKSDGSPYAWLARTHEWLLQRELTFFMCCMDRSPHGRRSSLSFLWDWSSGRKQPEASPHVPAPGARRGSTGFMWDWCDA